MAIFRHEDTMDTPEGPVSVSELSKPQPGIAFIGATPNRHPTRTFFKKLSDRAVKIYTDFRADRIVSQKVAAKIKSLNGEGKSLSKTCVVVRMPFGSGKDSRPNSFKASEFEAGSFDAEPLRFSMVGGGYLPANLPADLTLPQSERSHGTHQKLAIVFDGTDSVVEYPAYIPINIAYLWVQKLLEYTSFLDAVRECSALHNSLNIILRQMRFSKWGIYKRGESSGAALTEQELNAEGLGFFSPKKFRVWLAQFNTMKFCTGNVYIDLSGLQARLDGSAGQPFGILPSQYMTPLFGKDLSIERYLYRPGVRDHGFIPVDPENLIHFRAFPNARLPLMGLGLVEANRSSIQTWLDLKSLFSHIAANGMFPSLAISGKSDSHLNKADMDEIVEQVKATNSGKGNYGKTLALASAVDIKELTGGFDIDMLQKTIMLCDALVYNAFEIPSHFWVLDPQHEPKYANIEKSINIFRFGPINDAWLDAKEVSDRILMAMGKSDKFEFRYALAYESSRENMQADLQNGVINRAEYRDMVSYPEDEDEENMAALKKYTVVNTTVDLVHALNNVPPKLPTNPDAVDNPLAPKPQAMLMKLMVEQQAPSDSLEDPDKIPAPASDETKKPPETAMPPEIDQLQGIKVKQAKRANDWRATNSGGYRSKPVSEKWTSGELKDPKNVKAIHADMTRLSDASFIKHVKHSTDKYERFLSQQLKRIMDALKKHRGAYEELLAKYPAKKKDKAARPDKRKDIKNFVDKVFDHAGETDKIGDIHEDVWGSIAKDAVDNTGLILTIRVDTSLGHKIADEVSIAGRDTAPLVSDTTQQALEDYIKDSVADGDTYGEMANEIYKGMAGDVSDYVDPETGEVTGSIDSKMRLHDRAELIARTETHQAYDKAAAKFMKETGVVEKYQIINCECNEWPCNADDIDPEDVDDAIEAAHPNHSGILVPQSYKDILGEEE